MKNRILNSLLVVLLGSLTVELPVKAEQVCQVTDPTGIPLTVRDSPDGDVINALRNGREVYILETAYDEQGRPWAKIAGYYRNYRIWG